MTFEDCVLTDADFQASEIEATRFHGWRLDSAQLVGLAPALAAEAGITVADD